MPHDRTGMPHGFIEGQQHLDIMPAARQAFSAGSGDRASIEEMVTAAATIATLYPHINDIGGDSFWLLSAS